MSLAAEPLSAPRAFPSLRSDAFDVAFFAFVCFGAMGSWSRFGVDFVAWGLIYAVAALLFLRDGRAMAAALGHSWIALALPVVALLSTLWSVSAAQTLYASFQFTFTVLIAIWAGARLAPIAMFLGLALGAGLGVGLSLANLVVEIIPAWMNGSAIGVYAQKNVFAKVVMLGFLGATVALLAGAPRRGGLASALLLWLLGTVVAVGLILLARSVSTIAFFLFCLAAPALWALGRGAPGQRVVNVGYVALVGLAILGFVLFGFPEVIDAVLASVEKDATLTGRTVLWAYADRVIDARPLLGVGYHAFWDPDVNPIVRAIRASVDERIRGFHNVYFEVMVATGLVGLAALIAFLALAAWRAIVAFAQDGGLASAAALVLTVLTIIIGAIENVMFRQHEIFQILIVALFVSAGCAAEARRRRSAPIRSGDQTVRDLP